MQKKTNGSKIVTTAVIGASLAGLAATAYFFFGPKGKKHQQHAKAWVIKMKGDVVSKLEKAKEVSEGAYHQIIDSVAKEYAKKMKLGSGEIEAVAKDLKAHWKTIGKAAKAAKQELAKAPAKKK